MRAGELVAAVEARISLDASDGGEQLRALYRWLQSEDDLRGRVRFLDGAPANDEMGAVTDVLMVALGGGGAGAVLAGALSTWLRTRGSDVTVRVTDEARGRTVTVTVQRADDAEALVREVLADRAEP